MIQLGGKYRLLGLHSQCGPCDCHMIQTAHCVCTHSYAEVTVTYYNMDPPRMQVLPAAFERSGKERKVYAIEHGDKSLCH